MTVTLFRQQAVDHQRLRIWGEAPLALPGSYALMTSFVAVSVVAASLFVSTQTYARKEHAAGFLLPVAGMARIVPPRGGTITAVAVTEGQHVERDALLLTVTDAVTSEHGENIDAAKLDELHRQLDRLKDQIALEHDKAAIEAQRLQAQIDGGNQQIAELQRQLAIEVERIEIARQQVSSAVELTSKGYLSKVELRRRQDAYLGERESHSVLVRDQAARQAELTGLEDALRQLPMATAERVAQLEASIAEVDTRLKEIEGQRGYQLRAPVAGRVSALQASIGKTADPKIPVLSIVPDDDFLEAELLVPARAIGFVTPGQTVQISYDTFPFEQFGFARGTVRSVSHTLLKPEEIVGPVQPRDPSYPVYVTLERQTISAYRTELPLEPDLQLRAEIVSERRGLLAWILDPVLSVWRRS
jgi:membrane fusion protein